MPRIIPWRRVRTEEARPPSTLSEVVAAPVTRKPAPIHSRSVSFVTSSAADDDRRARRDRPASSPSAIEIACVVDAQAALIWCVRSARADVLRELGMSHCEDLEQESGGRNGSVSRAPNVLDELRVARGTPRCEDDAGSLRARPLGERPTGRDALLSLRLAVRADERNAGVP
jgi:hypothetical protein